MKLTRLLLMTVVFCLAGGELLGANRESKPKQEKVEVKKVVQERLPNIIFILADDLGSGDLGAYNPESKVKTPHMDRLAKEGMRFTDAHSPSSVCTPTRYATLTGRYAWRSRLKSGVLWGYSPMLIEEGRETIASMLKKKGYHTAGIGKWHLGLGDAEKTDYSKPLTPGPVTVGFDYYYGIPASLDMDPYVYIENDRPVQMPTAQVARSKHRRQGGGGYWRAGPVAPDFKHIEVLPRTTEKAKQWLKTRAMTRDAKPFFLYLPMSAPHTPWLPTEEFRGKSGAGYYGDFVRMVDHNVGEILKVLDEHKLVENTMVVMTSDNGSHWPVGDIKKYGHAANLHYRGQKADIHEGGHRVPLLVRWPATVKPGSVVDQTVCLTDFYATIADIVEHEMSNDEAEDSFTLMPLLKNPEYNTAVRPATVHHSLGGMFAIRQGDWKLIIGRGSGGFTAPRKVKPKEGEPKGQLYHLGKDPSEQNNVYAEHPEVVKVLTELLNRYRKTGRSRD